MEIVLKSQKKFTKKLINWRNFINACQGMFIYKKKVFTAELLFYVTGMKKV